jgi:hypothetical protein
MLADIFALPRAAPTFIAFRDHILGHKIAIVAGTMSDKLSNL